MVVFWLFFTKVDFLDLFPIIHTKPEERLDNVSPSKQDTFLEKKYVTGSIYKRAYVERDT